MINKMETENKLLPVILERPSFFSIIRKEKAWLKRTEYDVWVDHEGKEVYAAPVFVYNNHMKLFVFVNVFGINLNPSEEQCGSF